jgi:predicted nucleic acid-binding protein
LTYLLDTNLVSELRKVRSGKADAGVAAWAGLAPANRMSVSVITLVELETGVVRAESKDPAKGKVLRAWFEGFVLSAFEHRCVPVDVEVARQAAAYRARTTCDLADALIAATAQVHRMTVATRNVRDFEALGVRVLNPWAA